MRAFEVNITYRCNQSCQHCDRLRDRAPLAGDADIEQVERLCGMIVSRNVKIGTLKISGGEPLMHPEFSAIVHRLAALPKENVNRVKVLTNGTLPKVDLGARVGYWESPVAEKSHSPVLIAPGDHGARGVYGMERPCPNSRKCGPTWDCYGFTPCPPAGAFGHAAGVDPYSRDLVVDGHSPICRLCFLSLGRQVRQAVLRMVATGEIEHPSPTYARGLARLREDRVPFSRW